MGTNSFFQLLKGHGGDPHGLSFFYWPLVTGAWLIELVAHNAVGGPRNPHRVTRNS
jgi:hypothetical protein